MVIIIKNQEYCLVSVAEIQQHTTLLFPSDNAKTNERNSKKYMH